MTDLTVNMAKGSRWIAQAIALALAVLLAISAAGCANKPTKQSKTVPEFLGQPRPQ